LGHTPLLTNGQVFGWGENYLVQLGFPTQEVSKALVPKLGEIPGELKIKTIHTGL
jgi:hypothetical protein